ncbi:MAG: AtpZ/AtpI family protein [Bdellovibrionaceae bacterium]|nr:AtpZ/AtpI family protein [Pseudobdellovibrionaceae bacterium]
MNKYLIFSSIGFELVGIIVASIYFGQSLDDKYQTKGMALIALIFIGLVSWLTHVIILLRRFQKDEPNGEDLKE